MDDWKTFLTSEKRKFDVFLRSQQEDFWQRLQTQGLEYCEARVIRRIENLEIAVDEKVMTSQARQQSMLQSNNHVPGQRTPYYMQGTQREPGFVEQGQREAGVRVELEKFREWLQIRGLENHIAHLIQLIDDGIAEYSNVHQLTADGASQAGFSEIMADETAMTSRFLRSTIQHIQKLILARSAPGMLEMPRDIDTENLDV